MYASVIGVILPGKDTLATFGARVTAAALTMGGVCRSLDAARSSCSVLRRRGRYPAKSATATSIPSSSVDIISRFGEAPLRSIVLVALFLPAGRVCDFTRFPSDLLVETHRR